jgi:hypothetical protein
MTLALALIAGVAVTGYGYFHVPRSSTHSLLFARLQDDKDESASRLFRERVQVHIDRAFPSGGATDLDLRRYFKSFAADVDLRRMLREEASVDAIVWGDSQLARISMRERAPLMVERFEGTHLSSIAQRLEIVDSVPVTAIAFEPRESTAFFLARVFEALASPLEPGTPDFSRRYSGAYAALSLAADEAYRYPSRAHRAFVMWRSGTNSLLMFLNSGGSEPGYVECARAHLERAQAMLVPRENPDLSGAILNNLGVAAFLRAEVEGDAQWLPVAERYFADGSRTGKMRTVNGENPGAFRSAQRNLAFITGRSIRAERPAHHVRTNHPPSVRN